MTLETLSVSINSSFYIPLILLGVLHPGSVSLLQRGQEREREDGDQAAAEQRDIHCSFSTS